MTEYTGWNQPLLVTLTATTNPYLAHRLPLRGLLTVHEMRTDGYAQPLRVGFRAQGADGSFGASVAVDDPEFTYSLPTPGAPDERH